MSLASVRRFFRGRMNGLGFREHSDAFDEQNVPQSTLDNTYRIESGPVASTRDQNSDLLEFAVTLRVFRKGGRSNVELVDSAWATADTIINDILQPDVRLGSDIKDVQLDSITVESLSASDDNDLILALGFTGILVCTY